VYPRRIATLVCHLPRRLRRLPVATAPAFPAAFRATAPAARRPRHRPRRRGMPTSPSREVRRMNGRLRGLEHEYTVFPGVFALAHPPTSGAARILAKELKRIHTSLLIAGLKGRVMVGHMLQTV